MIGVRLPRIQSNQSEYVELEHLDLRPRTAGRQNLTQSLNKRKYTHDGYLPNRDWSTFSLHAGRFNVPHRPHSCHHCDNNAVKRGQQGRGTGSMRIRLSSRTGAHQQRPCVVLVFSFRISVLSIIRVMYRMQCT